MRSGGELDAGLEAQRRAIAATCKRRGWQLLELREEAGFSAEDLKRPGIQEALRVLESGDAKVLVARKLDRPARSLLDLARLMASAQKRGWALVALDCAFDTTTPAGEAVVSVLCSFAQFERGLISQRIRQALARKRAQGVRLGRPPTMSAYAIERIRRERAAGSSLAAIANGLNADHVPTAQSGSRWYPATVRYTLNRAQ
ncbi:MAG TPA: recombinase family protein [Gaiellaceae bacterium]|nr:recombinase family protein [Gaiellaceae bacterium]